ncbi:hypothetical protein [Thermoactinospora rubra]|uniref:hypothetical protein n=1 Tax=Thermoactinospora rubra TaxID=1088767 RepID=UPI000A0FFEF8|nr:hypothetical protein [Thermoactinospora rubra]
MKPTDSTKPASPTNPTTSANPTTSGKPSKPGNPDRPSKPAKPTAWPKVTLSALLVRCVVAVAGAAALAVALPAPFTERLAWPVIVVVVSVCSAVRPRSAAVGATLAIAFTLWVAGGMIYGETPTAATALLLGCLLYVHHSAAALGAQVPVAADVPARLLGGWALRVALVVGLSALLGLAVQLGPPLLAGVPLAVVLPVGALGAVGVAAVIRHLLRS